ncbi:MAG: NUDIX hydrolase [Paracoccaceae bacterium]
MLPPTEPMDAPIRDAATVILVRDASSAPKVLMGQRGARAAFMPDKYVFPGGAVDGGDGDIALAGALGEMCHARLWVDGSAASPDALATAAIRELWEETGQSLGVPGAWSDAPKAWTSFAALDLRPDASALRFFFRAVTPPGRPRRFDARFFLADAEALSSDPDDFAQAEAELSHVHWVALDRARDLNLPFITRVVLGELESHLPRMDAPDRVAFVKNEEQSQVVWL